jgi:hypothetical protein
VELFFCLLVGAKNGAEGVDLDFRISIEQVTNLKLYTQVALRDSLGGTGRRGLFLKWDPSTKNIWLEILFCLFRSKFHFHICVFPFLLSLKLIYQIWKHRWWKLIIRLGHIFHSNSYKGSLFCNSKKKLIWYFLYACV